MHKDFIRSHSISCHGFFGMKRHSHKGCKKEQKSSILSDSNKKGHHSLIPQSKLKCFSYSHHSTFPVEAFKFCVHLITSNTGQFVYAELRVCIESLHLTELITLGKVLILFHNHRRKF